MIAIRLLLVVAAHLICSARTQSSSEGTLRVRPVPTNTSTTRRVGTNRPVARVDRDDDPDMAVDDEYTDDYDIGNGNNDYYVDDQITDDYYVDDELVNLSRFTVFTKGDFGMPRQKWNSICIDWCDLMNLNNNAMSSKNGMKVNWRKPVTSETCGRYIWYEFKDFCGC